MDYLSSLPQVEKKKGKRKEHGSVSKYGHRYTSGTDIASILVTVHNQYQTCGNNGAVQSSLWDNGGKTGNGLTS